MAYNYNLINRYNNLVNKVQNNSNLNDNAVGDLKWTVRNNDFNGWLKCDGRLVSKDTYSHLYDLIGHEFANVATPESVYTGYFRLPDARSRVLGMIGPSRTDTIDGNILSTREMGDVTGNETHTLTLSQMPSHTHGVTDPGHSHGYRFPTNQSASDIGGTNVAEDIAPINNNSTTSLEDTNISIVSNGGGQPHNNMQPTLFIGCVFIFSGVDHQNPINV
jgi:microcystin-dependent protein